VLVKVKKAVIPAAGMGIRFLPATKAQPKEMMPIIDKPCIQYVVEEAVASGIDDILIITGRMKRSIEDHFDKSYELEHYLEEHKEEKLLKEIRDISRMADIHFIRQKEPLGLGHAVLCAKKHVSGEPFAVLLGDNITEAPVPCTRQLLDAHAKTNKTVIAVQHVPPKDSKKYGWVSVGAGSGGVYPITKLIEKPQFPPPSSMAIVGRYILAPEIFSCLERTAPDKTGQLQLTDALVELLSRDEAYALEFKGRRYDVGDKVEYIKTIIEMAKRRGDLGEALLGADFK